MRLRESGIPDAARGVWVPWGSCLGRVRTGRRSRGSAPSAALGRLEDGSPRFACPVRPLGRLPLGGVYIRGWSVVGIQR